MSERQDTVVTPTLRVYGNTFAELESDQAVGNARGPFDGGNTRGDINADDLNKNKLSDTVEFTRFEETVKDYVLMMLGHPVVRVELAPSQLKAAVDQAVTKMYYHAPMWTTQMAVFATTPGVNIYKLPTSVLHNLIMVGYKKTLLSIQPQSGTLEFDYFIKYFQDNFLFNNFGVGDYQLLTQHLEQVRKVLGQEGTFDIINGQYLQVYPRPITGREDVIVYFRGLDSNTLHPEYLSWIQRYALAISKGVLGRIRGKHKVLPGPGGGTQLDGEELRQESIQEMEKLEEELRTAIEDPPAFTVF
jgi:hypothetical protein